MRRDSRDYPFFVKRTVRYSAIGAFVPHRALSREIASTAKHDSKTEKTTINKEVNRKLMKTFLLNSGILSCTKINIKNCKHLMKKQNKNHFTSEEHVECNSLTATSKYKRNLYKFR